MTQPAENRMPAQPTFELWQIPPDSAAAIAPQITPWLEAIAERSRGEWSTSGILDAVEAGRWQLFIVWNGETIKAVVGTELHLTMTGLKACTIQFCAGDGAKQWSHLIGEIEAFAKAEGCQRITMMARTGWAKHLKDYRKTFVALEKELN